MCNCINIILNFVQYERKTYNLGRKRPVLHDQKLKNVYKS